MTRIVDPAAIELASRVLRQPNQPDDNLRLACTVLTAHGEATDFAQAQQIREALRHAEEAINENS